MEISWAKKWYQTSSVREDCSLKIVSGGYPTTLEFRLITYI